MPIPRRIIVEMTPVGNAVKVSAICEDTGREVSVVGDRKASPKELEALAVRKLKFVMSKDDAPTTSAKRGIEV